MEEYVLAQAEHFLKATKYIFQHRGFCFSSAFILGDKLEVVKLDLSSDEKKETYARLLKKRFYDTNGRYLIVIHPACITQLSAEDMQVIEEDDGWPEVRRCRENTTEGLVVFISSREEGEVWQVPFTRNPEGIVFGKKQILKTILSENWMVNPNRQFATQLN